MTGRIDILVERLYQHNNNLTLLELRAVLCFMELGNDRVGAEIRMTKRSFQTNE